MSPASHRRSRTCPWGFWPFFPPRAVAANSQARWTPPLTLCLPGNPTVLGAPMALAWPPTPTPTLCPAAPLPLFHPHPQVCRDHGLFRHLPDDGVLLPWPSQAGPVPQRSLGSPVPSPCLPAGPGIVIAPPLPLQLLDRLSRAHILATPLQTTPPQMTP